MAKEFARENRRDESGGNPFREKGFPPLRFRAHAETFTPPSQKLLNKREKIRRRDAKQNGETDIKVFAPLFSKSGTFSRSPIGVSFSLAFSLRLWLQRKSGEGVCTRKRWGSSLQKAPPTPAKTFETKNFLKSFLMWTLPVFISRYNGGRKKKATATGSIFSKKERI